MSAHTKGPWVLIDPTTLDPANVTTVTRIEKRKAPIAAVWCDYSEPFASEQQDNARLIAAAPDLLEALIELQDIVSRNGLAHSKRASAAIAKATGETK